MVACGALHSPPRFGRFARAVHGTRRNIYPEISDHVEGRGSWPARCRTARGEARTPSPGRRPPHIVCSPTGSSPNPDLRVFVGASQSGQTTSLAPDSRPNLQPLCPSRAGVRSSKSPPSGHKVGLLATSPILRRSPRGISLTQQDTFVALIAQ